jgi:CubicO group peptidase (beta-lactamase class C family)
MVNPLPSATALPRLSLAGQRNRFAQAYALLEQAVADRVFPGCSFGAVAAGVEGLEVIALDAVGRQTYAEDSPEITPDTVYDLASVTKVVATTAMAMLLYDRGSLELDRPIGSILSGFGSSGERGRVTLRHLLAHASGLPGYARLFESESTPEGLMSACLSLPLQHPPGEHAEYSDIGFILLGKALEVLSGEKLASFCQREVFARCGMDRSLFVPPAKMKAEIPPTENDTVFRHRVIQGEVQDENCFVLGGISGHAGLFGNALDVLRFAAAVLHSTDSSVGKGLFRPATVQLFAARAEMPGGSSRALGWDTPSSTADGPSSSGTMFSRHSIGHLGYAGTSLWIDLEERVAIVLLANRTWPSRENQKIRKLRPVFHDTVRNNLRHNLKV